VIEAVVTVTVMAAVVVETVEEMVVKRSVTIAVKYVVNLLETVQDPQKEERTVEEVAVPVLTVTAG
jgi:hypothetical protein